MCQPKRLTDDHIIEPQEGYRCITKPVAAIPSSQRHFRALLRHYPVHNYITEPIGALCLQWHYRVPEFAAELSSSQRHCLACSGIIQPIEALPSPQRRLPSLKQLHQAYKGTTEPAEAPSSPQRHHRACKGTTEPAEAPPSP